MTTNSSMMLQADVSWPAAASSGSASDAVALQSVVSTSANNQSLAQFSQVDPSRRLTPFAAGGPGSNTPSNPDQTRYIAPAAFLTQVPGSNTGSLDDVIAAYMTGRDASPRGSSDTCGLVRFLSTTDRGPTSETTSSTGPDVDSAIADYKRFADDAAGLSLAVSLTQSFNSSVKRLTQGQ